VKALMFLSGSFTFHVLLSLFLNSSIQGFSSTMERSWEQHIHTTNGCLVNRKFEELLCCCSLAAIVVAAMKRGLVFVSVELYLLVLSCLVLCLSLSLPSFTCLPLSLSCKYYLLTIGRKDKRLHYIVKSTMMYNKQER
jgi:hypothetical protein